MRPLRFVPLYFGLLLPVWGSLTNGAFCYPGLNDSYTALSWAGQSCSYTDPTHQVSASFSLQRDGFSFSIASTGTAASANESPDQVVSAGEVHATVDTVGPQRPGYVEYTCPALGCAQLSANSGREGSLGYTESGMGGPYGTDGCASDDRGDYKCVNAGTLIPISLGLPITFTAQATTDLPDCLYQEPCAKFPISGSASIGYSVEFFEADGVTPVAVVTPEPRSLAMTAAGLLGWLAFSAFTGLKAVAPYSVRSLLSPSP